MRHLFAVTILFLLVGGAAAQAQTTIEWWQFWTDPNIKPTIEAIVAEFESQNPDIKVNLTDMTWANGHEKIVIAFASDSEPDVVELGSDWIAQFAAAGELADLTTEIEPIREDFQGWSMATYDDKIYARPWILGTRVLYFNRSLLRRAGYQDDFAPLSWIDFRDAVQAVNDLAPSIYGWGSNTAEKHRLYKKFMPFFWSAKGRVLSEDGRFCVVPSQQGIEAIKFYKEIHDCCGYVATQREIEDAFLEGKIGFIISGDWLLKRIQLENRTIDFGTSLMPGPGPTFGTGRSIVAGGKTDVYPGKSFLGGEFLAVSANSANPDAARKLIDFITSPANQVKFCQANRSANPSSRVAQQDEYFQNNPHLRTFVMQLTLSTHPPVDPNWVYMEAEIEAAVEQVLFHDAPPGETLRELQHAITELRQK
jgi:multiple sugar transport system substrate-binding protein